MEAKQKLFASWLEQHRPVETAIFAQSNAIRNSNLLAKGLGLEQCTRLYAAIFLRGPSRADAEELEYRTLATQRAERL